MGDMERTGVTRGDLVAAMAAAMTDPGTRTGRLAAAARVLTGRVVVTGWEARATDDFVVVAPRATALGAAGVGAWTRIAEAQPAVGEVYLTFPWRCEAACDYAALERGGWDDVLPWEGSSFLAFARHPDDGGPEGGAWRDVADGDLPADGHVVAYPLTRDGGGTDPGYAVLSAEALRDAGGERRLAYLPFPEHPEADAEGMRWLASYEGRRLREAARQGGACDAIDEVLSVLEGEGFADAASAARRALAGRFGAVPVEGEVEFGTYLVHLAIVRDDAGEALVRQVARVEDGHAVVRPLPLPDDEDETALVGRTPGETWPLSRCFTYDPGALARLRGGAGRVDALWHAELASGAIEPLAAQHRPVV